MGERAHQIENAIEQERGELDKNLHELERRVHDLTDWRGQFNRHPMLMMGLALGAGVALSTVGARRNSRAATIRRLEYASPRPHEPSPLKDSWATVKEALIGVGTDRLCNFIEELIPGFRQRYRARAA